MLDRIVKLLMDPYPHRTIALELITRLELGKYEWRANIGAVERPAYGYCTLHAAALGKKLGYDRISVLELGVAGGNGLIALEDHAEQTARALGIEVDVYGFDTGQGLPPPADYRDLPYHWKPGFFPMDREKLELKLRKARLVLGDVQQTLAEFTKDSRHAPIGAVLFDLDFYSSTAAALRMFDADVTTRLPRVLCYFDDIIGTDVELYNDYTGVRLAVREFNREHTNRKISPAYHLLSQKAVQPWYHQIFAFHDFSHSRYNDFVSSEAQQLPLAGRVSE